MSAAIVGVDKTKPKRHGSWGAQTASAEQDSFCQFTFSYFQKHNNESSGVVERLRNGKTVGRKVVMEQADTVRT